MIQPTIPPGAAGRGGADRGGVRGRARRRVARRAARACRPLSCSTRRRARHAPRFPIAIDGYFLPKTPAEIFAAGEQAQVPLLAGWNSQESGPAQRARPRLSRRRRTTRRRVRDIFGDRADEALKLYPGGTADEVQQAATDLAGDRFIALQHLEVARPARRGPAEAADLPLFLHPRPGRRCGRRRATAGAARGAVHSAEIEYALGNLATNEVYAWTPDDHKVSETLQGYVVNFVKTGNPNGSGLPAWPAAKAGNDNQVLHLDVVTKVEPDTLPRAVSVPGSVLFGQVGGVRERPLQAMAPTRRRLPPSPAGPARGGPSPRSPCRSRGCPSGTASRSRGPGRVARR